jgi:hypothetical protein
VDEDRKSGTGGGSGALNDAVEPGREEPVDLDPLPDVVRRKVEHRADLWIRQNCSEGGAASRGAPRSFPVRSIVAGAIVAGVVLFAIVGAGPRLSGLDASGLAGDFGQWRAHLARDRMLHASPNVGHWTWESGIFGVTGGVVWDNERQRGFLRLSGVVVNEPSRAQYQLWIFDAGRDERYPVDGGVFDVPPGRSEVVVPFVPARPVLRPTAFAITVERAGGTVVSTREKLVAVVHTPG